MINARLLRQGAERKNPTHLDVASPPPSARPRRRPFVRGVLLAAAIAAVAGAGLFWWRQWSARLPPLERGWPATVRVIAGTGVAGWRDGEASRARFADPFGVAVAPDGTVYVSDTGDTSRIRALTPAGEVHTVAGGAHGFADGRGDLARFDTPSGIAVSSDGTLYVADTGNNAIRRITPDGIVTTIAGGGASGYADGRGREARFNGPVGVAVDAAGHVIVADTYNDRIRAISADGIVTTMAGAGEPGFGDGAATDARFQTPGGVAAGAHGVIYVADTGNGVIRTIRDGTVSTITVSTGDGLLRPTGIAAGDGYVYVTDDRGRILEVAENGTARVLAGSGPGFRDGDGKEARFRRPAGIARAAPGRLIVSDAGNALVRTIAVRGSLPLRLPPSPLIDPHFDAPSFATIPLLWPIVPMGGPFEIAGTMGEARGAEGSERFHAGIDIRADEGDEVHAVRAGLVSSPVSNGEFGTLNEWLRIGPVTYVHIRTGRRGSLRSATPIDASRFVATYDDTGRIVQVRVKRGARFSTGEPIATVNAFNHVHLNVGWPGEEHNPLQFRLPHFVDTVAPRIRQNGIHLFGANGEPFTARRRGRVLVWGRVRIVVDAWDQVDGNRPSRRLGLYSIGYQILKPDLKTAPGFETPVQTLRFDRLGSSEAARLVYAAGSGIPYYGRRMTRFLYVATNTFEDGVAHEGFWDTSALPPGDYVVRVWARDIRGNAAVANRDLRVTVTSGAN